MDEAPAKPSSRYELAAYMLGPEDKAYLKARAEQEACSASSLLRRIIRRARYSKPVQGDTNGQPNMA